MPINFSLSTYFKSSFDRSRSFTYLLRFASSGQRQNIMRMCGVTITKTQSAYRDFAKGAIESHCFAIVIIADRRTLGSRSLISTWLPAASWWSQIVGCQWAPLRMAGLSAGVAVQNLKEESPNVEFAKYYREIKNMREKTHDIHLQTHQYLEYLVDV